MFGDGRILFPLTQGYPTKLFMHVSVDFLVSLQFFSIISRAGMHNSIPWFGYSFSKQLPKYWAFLDPKVRLA